MRGGRGRRRVGREGIRFRIKVAVRKRISIINAGGIKDNFDPLTSGSLGPASGAGPALTTRCESYPRFID